MAMTVYGNVYAYKGFINRVGQNRICAPCMTVYSVISLPKNTVHTPYIYLYMVLANPSCNRGASLQEGVGMPAKEIKKSVQGRNFRGWRCLHRRLRSVWNRKTTG